MRWPSVPAMVAGAARRWPDREAVVDGEVRWSYADLGARVEAAARAVAATGLAQGERVAIWAPNCAEWIVAALGTLAAGGVLVPLNTRFKGGEAADVLRRSGARVLLTVSGFLGTDYPALLHGEDLPDLRRTVLLRGEAPGARRDVVGWDDFITGGAGVDPAEAAARTAALGPDDVSDVLYTSGTTGRPKGVMTTHGQTLRVFEVWSDVVGLLEGDRYLVVNPFFHTFGYKAGILASLLRGATIVPLAVFDPAAVLKRVLAERITVLPGPPTLYQALLNVADRPATPTLRLAVTGAAVVPVELVARMRDDLGFRHVLTAYGLTEATGVVTMCRHGDDLETIATTSGCAIPGTEVRVVGDDGAPLPPGEAGEVVVRGYTVMRGYLDDPDATASAVRDGWLRTGDVGVLDERGYLRITDRTKDMFIVGGFNAYPAEIERVLCTHPAVAQAAVVGAPDERLGEVGVAFVVPRVDAHAAPHPDEIIAWSRDRLANYKVPRRVEVVDALPLNASGKVRKHVLRERVTTEEGR